MEIKINDNLIIYSDRYNVWIDEYKKNTEGHHKTKSEYRWQNITGYHSSLKNCLIALTNHKIGQSNAKTVKELKAVVSEIEKIKNDIINSDEIKNINLNILNKLEG